MPISDKQLEANRANAKLSTGPHNTARTRFNGVRHGLTATHVVLPWENEKDLDAIKSAFERRFKPFDDYERLLVKQAAESYWTLERSKRVETNMFCVLANQEFKNATEPSDNLHKGHIEAISFLKADKHTDSMRRYDAHHQRIFKEAIQRVEKMASLRSRHAVYEPPAPPEPEELESDIKEAAAELPLAKGPVKVLGNLLNEAPKPEQPDEKAA